MESLTPSTITISPKEYREQNERMVRLAKEVDRLNRRALEDSIKFHEQIAENKKLQLQVNTLSKMLTFFLDEFEGAWNGECDYELGQHYLECERYMRGRGRVCAGADQVVQEVQRYIYDLDA